jgi:hypothetical protein
VALELPCQLRGFSATALGRIHTSLSTGVGLGTEVSENGPPCFTSWYCSEVLDMVDFLYFNYFFRVLF